MSTYASPFWTIGGVVAGIGLGILASTSGFPLLLAMVRFVEPVGTIFVNAIRMAVIPLVVASLIAGIVSIGDERSLTRLGVRSLVVFLGLALSAAVCAAIVAAPVLARLDIDASMVEGLRPQSAATATAAPGVAQWFIDLGAGKPHQVGS